MAGWRRGRRWGWLGLLGQGVEGEGEDESEEGERGGWGVRLKREGERENVGMRNEGRLEGNER